MLFNIRVFEPLANPLTTQIVKLVYVVNTDGAGVFLQS